MSLILILFSLKLFGRPVPLWKALKHCTSYSCIRPEVRKIKLDPLAVEPSTYCEFGCCTADKDMPLISGVLGVRLTGVVVSVKVAEVIQLR